MNKKSPLKDRPLRNPGQSLDEEIEKIIEEHAMPWLSSAVFVVVLAGLEWYRAWTSAPYFPWSLTIVACLVVVIAAYKFVSVRRRVKPLLLGRDGERAVGQYLELLRESGARVFHDIVGNGFNIDHVVISEHGVYAIETKTYSKTSKSTVEYDGRRILIEGSAQKSDELLTQARAEARWLKQQITESTGKSMPVIPIVVFPGWFVTADESPENDVFVLNPRMLPRFLKNRPKVLARDELMLASFHISRFIRAGYDS